MRYGIRLGPVRAFEGKGVYDSRDLLTRLERYGHGFERKALGTWGRVGLALAQNDQAFVPENLFTNPFAQRGL